MAYRLSTFAVRAGLAVGLAAALASNRSQAGDWPSEVNAVYDIKFNGLDIGDFTFKSNTGPQGYTLAGNSKLSVLLGAFKWRGKFTASGKVGEGGPKPAGYTFDYRSGSKRGSVKLSFDERGVSKVSLDPPKKPSNAAVPLTAQHLRNVLDPLSAIMAMARRDNGRPCERTLAVFDGKHRFDLALAPREGRSEAETDGEFVCRVLYRPIAGHKPNKETNALTEGAIEVVLKPSADGKLILPRRITIPTAWGKATLVSKQISIAAIPDRRLAENK